MMSSSPLYVIVGLGETGFSCARYFREQGISFAMTDTRENPPQLDLFKATFPGVKVACGESASHLLHQAETIVLSPGVSPSDPLILKEAARGVEVIGDIELFVRAIRRPVIAITGTNAKSTVTTLVGLMAKEAGYQVAVGGNLGIPALDLLKEHQDANLYVLELSSFQLETTYSLKATVASILNISPDHLDRHQSYVHYQQAKHRIYEGCKIAVCNADDVLTDCALPSIEKKYTFTLGTPKANQFGRLMLKDQVYLAYQNECLLDVQSLPVLGQHYQANALAALAIGHAFGFPVDAMITVLCRFPGLPHRCQLVREREGVKWYNDSKGTNVGATQAAMEGLGTALSGKLIWIAGGVGKGADFHCLLPLAEKYVRHAILIGESAKELALVLGDHIEFSFAKTIDQAVLDAARLAHFGDAVLLSPACASFDMFKNYEHRGEVFTDRVNKLN